MQRAPSFLFALIAICAMAVTPVLAQNMSKQPAKDIGTFMTVQEAHQKALKKELIFIDIRTPGEWKETGVPASATPLTMHQSAARFFGGLNKLTLFDKSRPIAVMCAHGNRSTFLQKILRKQGYTNIINVAEGMYGSSFGPGWLKSGLPLKPYADAQKSGSKTN